MIKEAWKALVLAIAEAGQYPDSTDAYILTKACANTGIAELARKAISEMRHLDEHELERMIEILEAYEVPDAEPADLDPANMKRFTDGLDKLASDIDIFDSRTAVSVDVQDFSAQALPMMLTPPLQEVSLPEPEMKKLYDELSNDASSTTTPDPGAAPSLPQKSRTGIPLPKLRYENWKSLTYLVAQANKADNEYLQLVDKAITSGERPPARHAVLVSDGVWGGGLSDPMAQSSTGEAVRLDLEQKRARILDVRGITPTLASENSHA